MFCNLKTWESHKNIFSFQHHLSFYAVFAFLHPHFSRSCALKILFPTVLTFPHCVESLFHFSPVPRQAGKSNAMSMWDTQEGTVRIRDKIFWKQSKDHKYFRSDSLAAAQNISDSWISPKSFLHFRIMLGDVYEADWQKNVFFQVICNVSQVP